MTIRGTHAISVISDAFSFRVEEYEIRYLSSTALFARSHYQFSRYPRIVTIGGALYAIASRIFTADDLAAACGASVKARSINKTQAKPRVQSAT